MGLGPPTCRACRTIALYEQGKGYWCPSCGNTEKLNGLWEFDPGTQEEMWNNHRFWFAIKQGKEMIEQEKKMITEKQGEGQVDVDADLAYFKEKLEQGLANGQDVTKLRKQIELLEDAMVVYRLTTPPRGLAEGDLGSIETKQLNG